MTYGSGNSGDYKKLKGQMIQVTDTDPVVYAGAPPIIKPAVAVPQLPL